MPDCHRLPQATLGGYDRQKKTRQCRVFNLAEREGFEPSERLPARLISNQVHSTTLPPLRKASQSKGAHSIRILLLRKSALLKSIDGIGQPALRGASTQVGVGRMGR